MTRCERAKGEGMERDPISHLEVLRFAIGAAKESPCQSKRGVVIWDDYGVVSIGFNDQPRPYVCDGSDRCKISCHRTAVHAEQAALLHGDPSRIRGAQALHIKVDKGHPVHSGGPSCLQCSKLLLAAGVTHVWLLHHDGWKQYGAAEFNWKSSTGSDHLVTVAATAEVLQVAERRGDA